MMDGAIAGMAVTSPAFGSAVSGTGCKIIAVVYSEDDRHTCAVPAGTTIEEVLHRVLPRFSIDRVKDGRSFMTSSPHRGGKKVHIEDRIDQHAVAVDGSLALLDKFLCDYLEIDRESAEFVGMQQGALAALIYTWTAPVNKCNRCGICCMFSFKTSAYGTPRSKKSWLGKGSNRCENLVFDDIKGVYKCAVKGRRSYICEKFICPYMEGGKYSIRHHDASAFSRQPDHPACAGCTRSRSCRECRQLPSRVEWFIAFARKNPVSPDHAARAGELRQHLMASKILYQRDHGSRESCVDPSWADHLIAVLDAVAPAAPAAGREI